MRGWEVGVNGFPLHAMSSIDKMAVVYSDNKFRNYAALFVSSFEQEDLC